MKRSFIIPLFIGVHILCIVAYIYKHSLYIQTSYKKQQYEQDIEQLLHKKEELTQQLQSLKNRTHIKQFAQTKLNMKPTFLKQIKKIDYS